MIGLLDCYSSRKRKRQEEAEREAERAEGSVRPLWMGVQGYKQS